MTSLSYLDVLRATVQGPQSLSRVSVDLALANLGADRSTGSFILLEADYGRDGLHDRLRELGYVRLEGRWLDASNVERLDRFVVVRAMSRRSLDRLVLRYRCEVVARRDDSTAGRVVIFPAGAQITCDDLDPDRLAREIASRKERRSFRFAYPPQGYMQGLAWLGFIKHVERCPPEPPGWRREPR